MAIYVIVMPLIETCGNYYENKEARKYGEISVYTRNVHGYLTFSLHWKKAMRERKGDKKAGSFLLNSAQWEDSLIIRFGFAVQENQK